MSRDKNNATQVRGSTQMASILNTSSIPQRRASRRASNPTSSQASNQASNQASSHASSHASSAGVAPIPKRTRKATTKQVTQQEASAAANSVSLFPVPVESYAARIGYTPSRYQADIFTWVEQGHGNAVVNAVAGGGKSTVAVSSAQFIPRSASAIFLAFNKHIAAALTAKLSDTPMTARTIHSAGYSLVAAHLQRGNGGGRIQTDDRKYQQIAKALTFGVRVTDDQRRELQHALVTLGSKARATLTEPHDREALDALSDYYGITLSTDALRSLLLDLIPHLLKEGERLARDARLIDFDDMISLPAHWNLRPAAQVEYLFVDELQDLSRAQLDTALRLLSPEGRFIGVGDPFQSIMAFAGADADSFYRAARQTNAQSLPLSICYRCPTAHLALAREIVPQIEARPNAPEGVIDVTSTSKLPEQVRPGDMILCRLTAPLIAQCIHLIEEGIPARVRGRDIGKQLASIVRAVENMPRYTWLEFGKWLAAYEASQIERLLQREDSASAVESMTDRCAAIRACYERFNAPDAATFRSEMEALFADDRPAVMLSTVHRAKGLEAERVFILRPDTLPLVWPKQKPYEAEQEQHIRYVALTRATNALFWVY